MTHVIQNLQPKIDELCENEGIKYLGVFGSQARGDYKENSDIDLLVEFQETPSLIRFINIKHKLEDLFKKEVDLVTKKSLSKYLKPYIMEDLKTIKAIDANTTT